MFTIGNKQIGDKNCFIIAEIGQNHQGDISIAKAMILAAKVHLVEVYIYLKT